jgi:hypothetical protein
MAFLTHALNENNVLIHVDDVPNGAKCNCHCPRCDSPLYAKNGGQEREHHFAHAPGQECEGAYESALHILAKNILLEIGEIMLPPSNNDGFPSGLIKIFDIHTERYDERYNIRPDLEGIMSNGERLLIEFYVSHKIDNKKRQIIIDNKLKCLEIDINFQSLNKNELAEFLTKSIEDRRWITSKPSQPNIGTESYSIRRNPIYEKTRDILKEIFEENTLIIHPYEFSLTFSNKMGYDLKEFGYDICEVNSKYRGFRSDLLLYRSHTENKGYISINIRGRRRNDEYKRPKDLRVIDIIIKYTSDKDLKKRWSNGNIRFSSWETEVYYYGFKN